MSQIKTNCPHCHQQFSLDKTAVGQVAECDNCQTDFTVTATMPKKKSHLKTFMLFFVIICLGTTLPFILANKDEIQKAVQKKEPVLSPEQTLLHVTKGPQFEAAQQNAKDSSPYLAIAKTYPNFAGVYPLLAGNAKLEGTELYHDLQTETIKNWTNLRSTAKWKMAPATHTGKYDVYVRYSATPDLVENGIKVTVAGQTVSTMIRNTGGFDRFARRKLGTIKLKKGQSYEAILRATFIEEDTTICHVNAVEITPSQSPYRWFDTAKNEWSTAIPRSFRLSSKTANQQAPVQFIKNGPKTYVIITTLEFKKYSKKLKTFIKHKESLGYTVELIDELVFGTGTGQKAAKNIRTWLHKNYKSKNILYALLIGKPDPKTGNIPMGLIDNEVPSDSIYMDCNNPLEDFTSSSYDTEKGLDSKWEVLVGRLPYFGENSAYFAATDLDAILEKTIKYETATPKEILERYHFTVDGQSIDAHFPEFTGFPYSIGSELATAQLSQDYTAKEGQHYSQEAPVSFATFTAADTNYINAQWHSKQKAIAPQLNILATYSAAKQADPSKEESNAFLHLRKSAIASIASSYELSEQKTTGQRVQPSSSQDIYRTILLRGHSIGQAHWSNFAQGKTKASKAAQSSILIGDPSITPFPARLRPESNFTVRPVHDLEHAESTKATIASTLYKQEYDIQNLSKQTQTYSITSDVDWLTIKTAATGSIASGKILTISTLFDKKARQLALGTHKATLTITIGDQIQKRSIHYTRFKRHIELEHNFDKKTNKVLSSQENPQELLIDKQQITNRINRTLSFEITLNELSDKTKILSSPSLNIYVDPTDKTLKLDWLPHDYGKNKPYGPTSTKIKDNINLKGKTPLETDSEQHIAVSIDYNAKFITLFLNGKVEASTKIPSFYFALSNLKLTEGLNATIDNFKVYQGSSNLGLIKKLYEKK